jgi:hypothetical protein
MALSIRHAPPFEDPPFFLSSMTRLWYFEKPRPISGMDGTLVQKQLFPGKKKNQIQRIRSKEDELSEISCQRGKNIHVGIS